ncbi:alkaline shock response membrane anchor protein AmaP [Paenalkalicoccus suaedae]|uniref:Alkaline shock response membrane anchor protein AmaP n=1 Tax=Paenalkalicoccus suaedae TaxID=2592382 RepID=A0A859FB66_9BACI|nr:alkaline shock response membrane anchor protein AmaP [Paenalkalicoccus suaedae]QKS70048.1 alkaline shock response membrane anchor protein AmaP [Paenalkalicoccus suaedae]
MNAGLRFIVGLFGLINLLFVIAMILTLTGTYLVFDALLALQQQSEVFWILIGVLSFLGLLSLIFFLTSFKSSGKKGFSSQSLNVSTTSGEIGISRQAIESTVMRTVRTVDGIRSADVSIRIANKEEYVDVYISYTPFGDHPVQQTAKALQDRVKTELESWLEISVREVRVEIQDKSNAEKKNRVV